MYLLPWGIMAVLIVIIDAVSKFLIESNMVEQESIPLLTDVFHITFIKNPGASFGFMDEVGWARWFFIAVTVILIAAIILYTAKTKEKNKLYLTAVTFIIGGGIGNLIDRIIKGEVVDFLHFKAIEFPIFNIADCFVVVGVGLMIIYCIKAEIKEKEMKKNGGDTDGNL